MSTFGATLNPKPAPVKRPIFTWSEEKFNPIADLQATLEYVKRKYMEASFTFTIPAPTLSPRVTPARKGTTSDEPRKPAHPLERKRAQGSRTYPGSRDFRNRGRGAR